MSGAAQQRPDRLSLVDHCVDRAHAKSQAYADDIEVVRELGGEWSLAETPLPGVAGAQ
ncbi:hypothetical protein OG894_42970 (plasmid) [Streptomyces sp. NBC_01724]|uniref:hypothetical protein n=1 Tax=unclassified Streptomyces TaxID=2593676 RepID=UPI002E2F904E|nr:hypothetical protein [Streptomyces sp. NBC_01724]